MRITRIQLLCLMAVSSVAGVSNTLAQTLPNINLGGYNGMHVEGVDSSYNAGISQYVLMLGRPQYAGYNSNSAASFQAGTWLTAQDTTADVYSTIEGGPGQGGGEPGRFWKNYGKYLLSKGKDGFRS